MRTRTRLDGEKRLIDLQDLKTYLSVGDTTARKIATASGAAFRIGGRTLYDRAKVDAYIDEEFNRQQTSV